MYTGVCIIMTKQYNYVFPLKQMMTKNITEISIMIHCRSYLKKYLEQIVNDAYITDIIFGFAQDKYLLIHEKDKY